jgi:hypothetical protein
VTKERPIFLEQVVFQGECDAAAAQDSRLR